MKVVLFLAPWLIVGALVLWLAFRSASGSTPGTRAIRTSAGFRLTLLAVYVGVGVLIPVLVLSDRPEGVGGTEPLASVTPSPELEGGKALFRQNCASCHSLAAVNARGVTGPNLDQIGQMTPERVL